MQKGLVIVVVVSKTDGLEGKLEARQLLRPCDIYTLLAAAGEGCCSADNVCGKLLAAGAMGVVSGGGQTTVEIEIFQRGQLPQGWREGDQPRVADGGVGQREALVNISFSPRLSNRHIHHPMPKAHGVGCTPFIPPASLPLAVASCKGPPTMQLGSVAGFGRKLQTASSNRRHRLFLALPFRRRCSKTVSGTMASVRSQRRERQ